jgi:hypothetical protein
LKQAATVFVMEHLSHSTWWLFLLLHFWDALVTHVTMAGVKVILVLFQNLAQIHGCRIQKNFTFSVGKCETFSSRNQCTNSIHKLYTSRVTTYRPQVKRHKIVHLVLHLVR